MAERESSILDDVKAASDELQGIERPEAPETPASEGTAPEKPEGDKPRDESGRFAKQERETLRLKEQPADKAPRDRAPATGKPGAEAAPAPVAPPAEWKGDGKVDWNRLPKAVQAELNERYTALRAERQELAPLKEVIDANRAEWVNAAGSVASAIGQLAQFHKMYLTEPARLIQHIARSAGIDLRAFGQPQSQQAQPQQPQDIGKMLEQLVEQRFQPIVAAAEQRETQQIVQSVEGFRADPKHPYFEDVRMHMGHLIRSGAAKDLEDAYDQATWANKAIREKLQQEQSGQQDRARTVARAQQARQASVRGAPFSGGLNGNAANGRSTVLDDVREAAAELAAR